jgi:uncharacterized membrane protein YvbJ
MKYCAKCGTQLEDDAVICIGCGRFVEDQNMSVNTQQYNNIQEPQATSLSYIAYIFMVIGTVVNALCSFGIALAWCLPLTNAYNKKIKSGMPISTGFKVCSLLFVNTVAGVLMLCDKNN